MTTILDTIFEAKRERVANLKRHADIAAQIERASVVRSEAQPNRLRTSLARRRDELNIIAEFKKASPSKGVIDDRRDPATTAKAYEAGGASAISVLTEEDFFKGSINDLKAVRSVTTLPILRKDFIFDEFQIYEAAAAGADAILLIVASLTADELRHLRSLAEEELGMDALVEVHTVDELEIAESIGAHLIGVNNRDLKTFAVSLDVSRRIAEEVSTDAILVSESGLRTRDELVELSELGYAGFLIGESLMRSADPAQELRKLVTG